MEFCKLYIKSDLTLDDLGVMIRMALNVNITNITKQQKEQKRFGENYGGDYYLFEIMGIEIYLLSNKGEIFEEDFKEFEFYLLIKVFIEDKKIASCMAKQIAHLLNLYQLKTNYIE